MTIKNYWLEEQKEMFPMKITYCIKGFYRAIIDSFEVSTERDGDGWLPGFKFNGREIRTDQTAIHYKTRDIASLQG